MLQALGRKSSARIAISAIEHPSITSLADQITETGDDVERIVVDSNGVISLVDLARCIKGGTRIVAAMLANNETGVVQPIADLAAMCNQHNIPLHVDAAQAIGKLPINFQELGAATMSAAAHKFGGPLGIGALFVRGDIKLHSQLFGGFQQGGTRPGTESVALAVGMCRALELWKENRPEWSDRLRTLRDNFEKQILAGYPTAVIIGAKAERLPHTSNIAFVGLDRQQLFLALDQAGVACSTGSACASGSSEPSPTHIAMNCDSGVISSALRFSFGVATTIAEVEEGVERILKVSNSLRQ
jgi:cysteine desulfurase